MKCVSGNKVVQLVANKVDDLNTGNHDTKSTSKGNIHGNIEKRCNNHLFSNLPFSNNSNIVYTGSSNSTINNISSSSNQSFYRREINILVMETCKQVVARENNKTSHKCKVGHVNNNCNENVGLSILNNGGVKDSRKLTAFERALALSK
ncbi:unnamed protein product [Rhizophagus irregularis]|nr:unnamed protein product [Rhizophagus irregularis]